MELFIVLVLVVVLVLEGETPREMA